MVFSDEEALFYFKSVMQERLDKIEYEPLYAASQNAVLAIEKAIPRDPISVKEISIEAADGKRHTFDRKCPSCDAPFIGGYIPKYCASCGQRIRRKGDE